jgi:hypothetical protein
MMRSFAIVSVCALLAAPAGAQTAREIIAKNQDALGGSARLQGVQTLRLVTQGPFGPQPDTVFDRTLASQDTAVKILEAKRPNLARTTILVPGFSALQYDQAVRNNLTPDNLRSPAARRTDAMLADEASRGDYSNPAVLLITGFDGKSAWRWNSHQRALQTLPTPTGGQGLIGFLLHEKDDNTPVELQGTATVDGKRCYKLRSVSASGVPITTYIDTITYLDVASEVAAAATPMGTTVATRTVYRNWKAVDGIMIPHTWLTIPEGGATQTQTVTKVELNGSIDDGRFAPPRDGK